MRRLAVHNSDSKNAMDESSNMTSRLALNKSDRNAKDESSSCKVPLKFKTIAYVAIAALVIWLVVYPHTSTSIPHAISSSSAVASDHATTTYSNNDCHARLDSLEQAWDKRQKMRALVLESEATRNLYAKRPGLTFDLFEPEAVCLLEERLGGNTERRYDAFGDGPKFVCGVDYLRELYAAAPSLREETNGKHEQEYVSPSLPCLVYSIGSNNDIKFERSIKAHVGCEIHAFDPTIGGRFVGGQYAIFHPWGLGEDNATVADGGRRFTTMSLKHMMNDLGHKKRKIDILKIDCEACEYKAMPPVFEAVAQGSMEIDQILIEMHAYHDGAFNDLVAFFAAADKAGFRITHKERNGWGCGGTTCVEYALTHASFLRRATEAAIC